MSNPAVIETEFTPVVTNDKMPVTRQDLERLHEKRSILKEFVSKQLIQGNDSDGDYAVITGCKKPSLLKPGAEKLKQLFGLGSRTTLTYKDIDHNANFAMFVYKCEIFDLRTGVVICDCEGSANSKEKKWATRSEWIKNEKGANEKKTVESPIYDNLNTLMKMAQKRAEVGAVVNATGASDFFTHDMDTIEDAEQLGAKPLGTIQTNQQSRNISVTGETVKHKDQLRSLGGKYNQNKKAWDFLNPNAETVSKIKELDGLKIE